MTIGSNTARESYNCNGSTTVFAVNIQAYLSSDFLVLLTNTTTGVSTTLVLNSDYTLAASGTLAPTYWTLTTLSGQFTSPFSSSYVLQIILNPSEVQQTQYVQGQAFPSLAIQTNFDRLTQMVIRLEDQVSRAISAPDGDVSPTTLLPTAANRALKYLAFDSYGNANCVAALPASSGVSPILINQTATNEQYANSGANIQRLNDRVMVGDACLNDGNYPNSILDWLSAFQTSQAGGPATGTILGCQFASLANHLVGGLGGAILGGAESLNQTSAGDIITTSSFAVNNNVSFGCDAWAWYGECHRMNNTVGQCVGFEMDVVQRGSLQQMTPYAQAGGEAVAYIAAAGAGLSATGQFAATAAFVVGANPMPFDKGIVFQAASISGSNGVTGTGYAIAMAKGHIVSWWATGGVQTGTIAGNGTTFANSVGIQLNENQLVITAQAGLTHTTFIGTASAVNSLNVYHSATGIPVALQTQGGDTNVDLEFLCAGAGTVRFGSAGMWAANGSVATALTSLGPTGSHATVQEWLTVKDQATGAVRFIPAF